MKRLSIKTIAIMLSILAVFCFAFAMLSQPTKAENEDIFGMKSGAEVYVGNLNDDNTGIKFTAQLSDTAFNRITQNVTDPVFFGIELEANEVPRDFCHIVDSLDKVSNFTDEVEFDADGMFTYTAIIRYNESILMQDLVNAGMIDSGDTAALQAYLTKAFGTEITAKAYYRIGDGAKVHGTNPVTRSMWGVSTAAYLDSESDAFDNEQNFLLDEKYFGEIVDSDKKEIYIQQDGEIVGLDGLTATDKIYLNANGSTVDTKKVDGKYYVDANILSGLNVNSKLTVKLSKVDANRNLTVYDAKFVSVAIDEVSDFAVFNLDEEYTLADGTTKIGEVVDGYYVMVKDINAQGTNMGLTHTKYTSGMTNGRYNTIRGTYGNDGVLGVGFTGEFDGQGHVISNFVPSAGGVFGVLTRGSAVCNVAFENTTVSSNTNVIAYNGNSNTVKDGNIPLADVDIRYGGRTLKERNALISTDVHNVWMRNIYVSLSADTTTVNGILTKNDQYDSNIYIYNNVIDASACNLTGNYSLFLANTSGMMNTAYLESIVVVTNKGAFKAGSGYTYYGTNQGKDTKTEKVCEKVYVYDNYSSFIADETIKSKFTASVWNTEKGVIFNGLKDEIYGRTGLVVKDSSGVAATKFTTADVTETFSVYDLFGKVELNTVNSSNPDIINVENGDIVIKQFVEGTYTVEFSHEYNSKPYTKTITIELSIPIVNVDTEAIYDTTENTVYYRDSEGKKQTVTGNATYVKDENTSYALSSSTVTQKFNGAVNIFTGRGDTSGRTGKLEGLNVRISKGDGTYETVSIPYSMSSDDYTGVKVVVIFDGVKYVFNDTVFATAVIDTGAELKQIFNKADIYDESTETYYGNITLGTYMLADNIDASADGSAFEFDNSYLNFFDGVLDGRGYSIFNLDVSPTDGKAGNGLFSDTSAMTYIQNIGFIDVKANNGSVFMGNRVGSYDGTSKVYRQQVGIADSDSTTAIIDYMTATSRTKGGLSADATWSNVYVKVHEETKRLMGVISRQMANAYDSLAAFNLVIEYLPDNEFDTSENANDGAVPFGYNYTNNEYGVLFGGTYTLNKSELEEDSAKSFYTPTGMNASGWSSDRGALNFVCAQSRLYYGDDGIGNKIYVISPVGLVSSDHGEILDVNGTTDTNNPYRFYVPTGYHRLVRFDNYTGLQAAGYTSAGGGNAWSTNIGSFGTNLIGDGEMWSFVDGALKWNNCTLG